MPLLTITTNISLDNQAAQALCLEASSHVANLLGKPESYVMISLQTATSMSFAGDMSPCARLELDYQNRKQAGSLTHYVNF